jgi:homoserine O-acetyltransferase
MADATLSKVRETGIRDADEPRSSLVARFGQDKPLKLDAGVELAPFQIAYKTYGALNAACTNAVLVCHALTGDQHVASVHPVTGKSGWWETLVGPGKPIDTERYFVICPNVVGGCMGTSGPASTDRNTDKPWGLEFPVVTIRDMVRAQAMLLDHLGFARRTERRAGFLALFGRDQPVDDGAALHQQPVHLLVDRVDLLAQIGE